MPMKRVLADGTTAGEGDKVTPKADVQGVPPGTIGRTFTVYKVNPKRMRCSADDGGRGINFPPSLLVAATEENLAARWNGVAPVRFGDPAERFVVGEVVSLTRPWRDWDEGTPLVVVGGRNGRVNVTLVGGYGDSYLRTTPSNLVRRGAEWLVDQLLEQLETEDASS